MGAELFHADKETGVQTDTTELTIFFFLKFYNFANASTKSNISLVNEVKYISVAFQRNIKWRNMENRYRNFLKNCKNLLLIQRERSRYCDSLLAGRFGGLNHSGSEIFFTLTERPPCSPDFLCTCYRLFPGSKAEAWLSSLTPSNYFMLTGLSPNN